MKSKIAMCVFLSIAVTACGSTGSNYQPITDGPVSSRYFGDLRACKRVAEKKRYDNDESRNKIIGGAVLGGLIGAGESRGDAAVGAVVGGLIGGAKGAIATKKARKKIVINCMKGRGHRVVG